MIDENLMLLTDSYKLSHYKQYPPNTSKVYSYFESRKGAKYRNTTFFGLQYYMKKYLEGEVISQAKIDMAADFAEAHMPVQPGQDSVFNRAGWERMLEKHGGRLPIRIMAVPEGMIVPQSNVLMTIENTDPEFWWLPNYLETLLVMLWYPCTVATTSNHVRGIIREGLKETGDVGGLPFKLHDFGFRGSTSVESSGIGGLAHLVNFQGTDTLSGILTGMKYYDAGMSGFSIPASEHSTITSWGEQGEVEAYRNMLQQYPSGLVACVSDSYDIERACSDLWGDVLKDEVLARNGTLVVRPDSGEIVSTVLDVLDRLGKTFGTHRNFKGYKMLHEQVRVIQGDGCTPRTISSVVAAMIREGWSVDNVAFGMGGGLLQKLDRDTQRFAFKCSSVIVDGEERDVYKRPKTDPTKNSKRGRLALVREDGALTTIAESDLADRENLLQEVFCDGEIKVTHSWSDIRARAAQ